MMICKSSRDLFRCLVEDITTNQKMIVWETEYVGTQDAVILKIIGVNKP